jgi:hypothetical protein
MLARWITTRANLPQLHPFGGLALEGLDGEGRHDRVKCAVARSFLLVSALVQAASPAVRVSSRAVS